MSKRRLDKLEDSLSPKEAVIHWLSEAQAFGSLPAYTTSLIGQPETAQPFIALPAQVEKAAYESMRRQRPGFIKEAAREAVGDTVFLLRLAIGLNVHVEETLRVERLRHTALYWWTRALDQERRSKGGRRTGAHADRECGAAYLRGTLLGTEQARTSAEARYLDGHDCLFPTLSAGWLDLVEGAEHLAPATSPDAAAVEEARQRVRSVVLMARADGLEASGQIVASDDMALRVGQQMTISGEHADG